MVFQSSAFAIEMGGDEFSLKHECS